ncbi:VOC family protein [Peribacillus frigoritolerans]|uniref:VOC family protein n=1 Tax=Peribacillus frigoritolerans TaxID=450367 RepID=UPI0020BF1534|nr:VOC family protein [Peribacillus frigoritolerans]
MNLRLELFVESIEKSVGFYRDILEFNAPKEIIHTYVPVKKGSVTLGLGEMKSLPKNHPLKVSNNSQQTGLGVEIVLEVEDINGIYNKVVEKGYSIQTKLTKRSWGLEDFRLIDPDGYYLRITSMATIES